MFIPKSLTETRPGIKLVPHYITVHETDNTSKGATAAAHARLQYNGNSRTASWHYTVDDHEIWQSIPDDEVAWHAGDGHNGTGNRQSLAVEICVNSDGDFEKAKSNAIWLIRQLMSKHNIPIDRVVPHQHWSGKNCPRHILTYWDSFVQQIKGASVSPSIQYIEDNVLPIAKGAKGTVVKKIQERLKCKVVDGLFGPATEADVKMWQSLHDENGKAVPAGKGLVADGIVGEKTYYAMFPDEKPQQKREPAYDVTVDGKNVMTSAIDVNVLKAIADAIKDNKAKEIKIERIDY